jgi:hypothetical protein
MKIVNDTPVSGGRSMMELIDDDVIKLVRLELREMIDPAERLN